MKTFIRCCMRALLMLTIAGCSAGPDSDSISSQNPVAANTAPDCLICHSPANPLLDPLTTNGSGLAGKHISHVTGGGFTCENCHSGYSDTATHMNGTPDTMSDTAVQIVFFDSLNPGGEWALDPITQEESCSSLVCHGSDVLEWYGTTGANFHECPSCHSYEMGARRQVLSRNNTGGDFSGNPGITSHHITGNSDPSREQCEICHDQTQHIQGTVLLKNADGGPSITYNPSNPASAEPFCLSCHDEDGATGVTGGNAFNPFNDGSVLGQPPYPYATRIESSWNKPNGHRRHSPGGLTCLGTGESGTGCHGNNGQLNAHGSAYQVLAAKRFKYEGSSTYVETDFALCFDCHAGYPGFTKEDIFGVRDGGILDLAYGALSGPNGYFPPYYTSGVTTHFADHNDPAYASDPNVYPNNDYATFWGGPNKNLHWYHLGRSAYFRGNTATNSGIICVNCHDVHGSATSYGAVYDEIGYFHFIDGANSLGQMLNTAYLDENYLNNYPTYCAFNCHYYQETTKAWYSPLPE